MVRVHYCPALMLNPFFNFWGIFLLCSCLFIIYLLLYVKYISNLEEIVWKILYFSGITIILFIYFFMQDFIIWQYFFNLINEVLIVKDTQDLVNIAFDLSLIYTIYFITPLFGGYLSVYLINFNQKNINQKIKLIFFCCLYYYALLKYLLDHDLFLANWEFFIKNQAIAYDFQPDLIYLVLTYLGDFYDLAFFFSAFIIYLLNIHHLLGIVNKKHQTFWRLSLHFMFSCFVLYFFGGEHGGIDFVLVCNSFIYLEFIFVIWLFFIKLKYKKTFDYLPKK